MGHVGKKRNACRILVREREGKRLLGRPRRRWENNTKCIFTNVIGEREPCSPGSGQGQVVGCCSVGWTVQSLFHETVHTGTGTHTASYSVGTGSKAAGA